MVLGLVTNGCCRPPPPVRVPFGLNIWALLEPKKGRGGVKFAWFKALKNSVRNCTVVFSLTAKFLSIEASTVYTLGPTMLLRPALPKRFEQLPGTWEKGTHCDAISGVAIGTLYALGLM